MSLDMVDVIKFYYGVPVEFRRWMRWVVSTDTARHLAALRGVALKDEDLEDLELVYRPVRIDDTAQGLSYELLPPMEEAS